MYFLKKNMKILKEYGYRKTIPNKEDDELVDKIASFFEMEENWKELKNCWLEDGRSDDFRKLLYRAINE